MHYTRAALCERAFCLRRAFARHHFRLSLCFPLKRFARDRYEISEDAHTALAALRAMGAEAVLDSDPTALQIAPQSVLPIASGPTVLLKDLNGTVLRLVPRVQTTL